MDLMYQVMPANGQVPGAEPNCRSKILMDIPFWTYLIVTDILGPFQETEQDNCYILVVGKIITSVNQ